MEQGSSDRRLDERVVPHLIVARPGAGRAAGAAVSWLDRAFAA